MMKKLEALKFSVYKKMLRTSWAGTVSKDEVFKKNGNKVGTYT